jgi:GAF domain-containing protein
MATGRTILLGSALSDPRFRENRSVQSNSIGAVLCAPVGGPAPLGVLYLQDRDQLFSLGVKLWRDDLPRDPHELRAWISAALLARESAQR